MHFITKKYVNLLSSRLENFKWTSSEVAAARCPLCGDSKKSKRKARGSFYTHKNVDMYHCYNCGDAQSFDWFLFNFDSFLHKEYKLELFKDSINPSYTFFITPKELEEDIEDDLDIFRTQKGVDVPEEIKSPLVFCDLKTFSELRGDHPARIYASKRKLNEFFDSIYYVSNFPKWASERFEQLEKWSRVEKHPRLILPCYDIDKSFMGFSARAFGKEVVKYCTFRLNKESKYFLFGMDRVDTSKRVYVFEGPIDSLFVENSVAVMCATLDRADFITKKNNLILVPDNEPRASVQVNNIKKFIEMGFNVTLWPDNFKFKDVNEAIMSGLDKETVKNIINLNSFSGLEANLRFSSWKKI